MNEKGFKKWMKEIPEAEHIGKVAVFYIPSKKIKNSVRNQIHKFFVSKHKAYTHESGEIRGYWHDGNRLDKDSHDRYEISFIGEKKLKELVDFLSYLCGEIEEKSIYMTMADESYLIRPKI
jgi:hypothetical protein